MSIYKVPQDVEAEDKLLGPFSFRQFIFLMITVASMAAMYVLGMILLPLALLPLPFVLFFGALALPLRKDQPMEVYLAAVISFILKPKKRLWQPDGIEYLVEVVAPKVEEKTYGNGYSQEEVQRRLSYLSNLVDSQGWAIRGVNNPNSSMQADLYNEAQTADDFLDESGVTAQNINNLINQADIQRRQNMMQRMSQAQNTPIAQPIQSQPVPTTPAMDDLEKQMADNINNSPYPVMQQSTITPLSEQAQNPPITQPIQPQPTTPQTSLEDVSPAIIDLARNHDGLSVETIQREAKRIRRKEEMEKEVVISLH